ncbi:hypothetical protein [Caulobacter sp. DWR1-3-2b1]|uniref:hypothetical protein n=1 Tax=Caulobacter sp. DWR1-3-2b1 TaxID=2804670 RepID=UPI003CEB9CD1
MLFRLAALVAIFGLASPAWAGRDDQWLLRQDGAERPVAIFLSWDSRAILFRATCDTARGELVLEYHGDGEARLSARDSLVLQKQAYALRLRTLLVDGRLLGRRLVDKAMIEVLSKPGDLEIDAPNIMGEPWYVGRAEPLLTIARQCR